LVQNIENLMAKENRLNIIVTKSEVLKHTAININKFVFFKKLIIV